ncbi:MAG: branched-chain amino acid ABC transporter permease, partial [Pseudorhodobacter sp.]
MLQRLALAAVLLALFTLPFTFSSSVTIATIIFSKSLAILGIFLLLQAGQVSFGHGMFFAVGAYTAAYAGMVWRAPDVILLSLGVIGIAGLSGLVIGLFVSRYRLIFFAMLNLAFSMVLFALLEKLFHYTGGTDGMRIRRPSLAGYTFSRAEFDLAMFYYALVLMVGATLLVWLYLRSPLGQALRAVKVNETRLEYIGLSANRTLLVAYVFSAILTGLGGLAFGLVQGLATPELTFWTRSGEFVFIAVLGGIGSVFGVFAGTLVYETVRFYAAAL